MKKLTTILCSLTFLATTLCAGAQIRATVAGKESGMPMQGATVFLQSATDSAHTYSTLTDHAGRFEFYGLPDGSYRMQVSFAGYSDFTDELVVANGRVSQANDILLSAQPTVLENITVNLQKPFVVFRPDKISLNISESALVAGGNAWEAMLKGPGMSERNEQITFRGKSISVLINGRKLNLTGTELKNMLSAMPAGTIEKIEILTIPSVKYEADGNVVVDIRLSKNKNYGISGSLTAGLGGGRYLHGNTGLNLNYRNKNMHVHGSYHYNTNEKYNEALTARYSDRNSDLIEARFNRIRRNSHHYKAGLDFDLNPNNTVGILLNGISIARSHYGETESKRKTADQPQLLSTVSNVGAATYFIPSTNLYFKSKLDSLGKQIVFNADYFSLEKSWDDHFTTRFYDAEKPKPYLLRHNAPARIDIRSASVDYEHPLSKGQVEAGLKTAFTKSDNNVRWEYMEEEQWRKDAGKTNRFIYKENINSGYLTYTGAFGGERYALTAGLRVEQTNISAISKTLNQMNKLSYTHVFPNVSITYTPDDDHMVGLSYNKNIVRYSFDVVNPFTVYQSEYSYRRGNPDILPEVNHNLDFSYTLRQSLVFGASYSRLKGVLAPVYTKQGEAVIHSQENLNHADLFYFYNNWYQPVGSFWTSGLYTYLGFLKYNTSTKTEGGVNANWVFQTAWENTFQIMSGWNAELSVNYITPHASGISKAGPVFFADAGISKTIAKNKAFLKLSVSDIFDTNRQREDIDYQGLRMHLDQKAESRFIKLQFTYKFGNKNVKGSVKRASKVSDLQERTNSN